MKDFFAMGGYGYFVWGSYFLTAAVLLANAIAAVRRHRRILNSLKTSKTRDSVE